MVFAEYQKLSTGWSDETKDYTGPKVPVPALGSDGVYHLDARKALRNLIADARRNGRKMNEQLQKGFVGFRLLRGERYSDAPRGRRPDARDLTSCPLSISKRY
jgi:hypothetical protein